MMKTPKPINLAGMMGQQAPQPMQFGANQTVNPLERLMQKMSGRSQGRAMSGIRPGQTSLFNMGKRNG